MHRTDQDCESEKFLSSAFNHSQICNECYTILKGLFYIVEVDKICKKFDDRGS